MHQGERLDALRAILDEGAELRALCRALPQP
jgi:hypothetical protein